MTGSPLFGGGINQGYGSMAGAPQALQMAYMRDPRLRLAQQLQLQGADSSPVQHWTQGAARLAQALLGGHVQDKADAEYQKQADQYQSDQKMLFAPVQEMQPSAAGTGPRLGAQMTTRQPTLAEIMQRGANVQSPFSQDTLRQLQMQSIQAQQAADARGTWKAGEQNGLKGQVNSATGEFKPDPLPRNPTGPQGLLAEYEYAKGQGFKGDLLAYQAAKGAAGRAPEAPAGPQPPFAGNGMPAQVANILLDPNIPPTDPRYHFAYSQATAPQERYDPASGQLVTIRPQLPPTIRQPVYPNQQAPAPQGMTPDAGVGPNGQTMPNAQMQPAPGNPSTPTPSGVSVQQVTPAKPKELTEGQALSAGFADRMTSAAKILDGGLDKLGVDAIQRGASSVPGVGNYVVSPDFQKFEQAKRNFINAQLRRESGATIQDSEFLSAEKQYFPQPGDSPAVIEQKRATRADAIAAMRRAAGNAYNDANQQPQPSNGGSNLRSKYGLE